MSNQEAALTDILADRLTEISDMADRVSHMIAGGLAESEAHEIRRAILAAGELRTALLDIQQTHTHSDRHPYGAAMLAHEAEFAVRP